MLGTAAAADPVHIVLALNAYSASTGASPNTVKLTTQ
jgi:hypothetical protein